MKCLVLVRHAKAVQWGYDDDFNRELTERGESDAARVSSILRSTGVVPDLMISSPAKRAMQTATIFAGEFSYPLEKIKKNQELYHGMSTGELIELIREFPAKAGCVFLFGHNPSFEFFARGLCRRFENDMPTSSAAIINFFEESWDKVDARSGELENLISPKTAGPGDKTL